MLSRFLSAVTLVVSFQSKKCRQIYFCTNCLGVIAARICIVFDYQTLYCFLFFLVLRRKRWWHKMNWLYQNSFSPSGVLQPAFSRKSKEYTSFCTVPVLPFHPGELRTGLCFEHQSFRAPVQTICVISRCMVNLENFFVVGLL